MRPQSGSSVMPFHSSPGLLSISRDIPLGSCDHIHDSVYPNAERYESMRLAISVRKVSLMAWLTIVLPLKQLFEAVPWQRQKWARRE